MNECQLLIMYEFPIEIVLNWGYRIIDKNNCQGLWPHVLWNLEQISKSMYTKIPDHGSYSSTKLYCILKFIASFVNTWCSISIMKIAWGLVKVGGSSFIPYYFPIKVF